MAVEQVPNLFMRRETRASLQPMRRQRRGGDSAVRISDAKSRWLPHKTGGHWFSFFFGMSQEEETPAAPYGFGGSFEAPPLVMSGRVGT